MDVHLTQDDRQPVRPRWTAVPGSATHPRSNQYLLDLDVELAEELDVPMRLAARPSVTAMIFETDAGSVRLADCLALASPGPGLLVLDGVLAGSVKVGDRVTSELLGAGDLIQPWNSEDAELVCEIGWRALVPARLAVLDDAFAQRVKPWPQITLALLRRAGKRARRLNVHRAISAQPRLEIRLVLLMWHLAARWGRVERGGVRLTLPLTHQLLGHLISAERPSVTHALARLAKSGLVSGHGDEWHLHGSVEDHLATMMEPPVSSVAQLIEPIPIPMQPR
jgi:CRP/FNR family transcriptional regulator, cyclic AMP receptor protein